MKYVVNEGCIGCGLCAGTCQEVFSMGDDGLAVAIDTEVPAAARILLLKQKKTVRSEQLKKRKKTIDAV